MAASRRVVTFEMSEAEHTALEAIARARRAKPGRAPRARMLPGYRETPSFHAVGRRLGIAHQTVTRCVERAWSDGVMAALAEPRRQTRRQTRRLRLVQAMIADLEGERDSVLQAEAPATADDAKIVQLATLRGIAAEGATGLVREVFHRAFDNRRQVGA